MREPRSDVAGVVLRVGQVLHWLTSQMSRAQGCK